MKPDTVIKEELIIETALRRFVHFGFGKTTFSEIAKDLGVSQQNLYYYFPDKKSLVSKAVANVMSCFLEAMQAKINSTGNLADKLVGMIEVKESFFEKYFMLAVERPYEVQYERDELLEILRKAENRQTELVLAEFDAAMKKGEIKKQDPVKAATPLLKALTAMQGDYRNMHVVPDHKSIHALFDTQKALIAIYVSGLKNFLAPCNN